MKEARWTLSENCNSDCELYKNDGLFPTLPKLRGEQFQITRIKPSFSPCWNIQENAKKCVGIRREKEEEEKEKQKLRQKKMMHMNNKDKATTDRMEYGEREVKVKLR